METLNFLGLPDRLRGLLLVPRKSVGGIPLLEQEFGYSNTQLGLIASLSEIAYATGKFINGPLADKVGGAAFS